MTFQSPWALTTIKFLQRLQMTFISSLNHMNFSAENVIAKSFSLSARVCGDHLREQHRRGSILTGLRVYDNRQALVLSDCLWKQLLSQNVLVCSVWNFLSGPSSLTQLWWCYFHIHGLCQKHTLLRKLNRKQTPGARVGPSQSPCVDSMESCRYMLTISGCALITDVIKRRALCMCEIKTMLSDISLVCRLSNSLTLTDFWLSA